MMFKSVNSNSSSAKDAVAPRPAAAPDFKIFLRVLDFATNSKFELINATHRINAVVNESGVSQGVVHLQSLHTTTALFTNEWQDALLRDFETLLRKLVDEDAAWRHDDPACSDCRRKNAASHLQSLLLGQSVSLQVRKGRMLLGPWQSVILAELDGPRTRSVSVQVMGG